MYMFNLLFKFDPTQPDGLFSGDDTTAATGIPVELRKSKNWLERKPGGGAPNLVADAEADVWENLGEASSLMLSSNPNPGEIGIRVAPHRGAPIPSPTATLLLVASFGKPVLFRQPQASPFANVVAGVQNVLTTFVSRDPVTGAPAALTRNTARGWAFSFGNIVKRPGLGPGVGGRLVDRYQFSVGVIVTDGATVLHYGEDPEMDVGP